MPDWIGNSNSTFKPLGASNHSVHDREENDYYATAPMAGKWLLELEHMNHDIWECACGAGHLSKVFEEAGHKVLSTDLIDRGYGNPGIDFLQVHDIVWQGDIVTNPPYKYAQQFVEKALELVYNEGKVAMFLKLLFMEGKARNKLFMKHPPRTIHVSSSRILCAKNGDFKGFMDNGGSAMAYAWYIWEKNFHGDTVIKWFN
jgi:hypothetical protein